MPSTGDDRRVPSQGPLPWVLIATATTLTAVTILLIWFAAVPFGPLICPAIDPAPRNCSATNRADTGVMVSAAVVLLYVATMLAALFGRQRLKAWTLTGTILLAVSPIFGYLTVAWGLLPPP